MKLRVHMQRAVYVYCHATYAITLFVPPFTMFLIIALTFVYICKNPTRPAYIFNDLRMYTYAITLSRPVYCCVAYVVPIRSAYKFNDLLMHTNAMTLSCPVYCCVTSVVAIRPAYLCNDLLPYSSRLYIQRPTYVYKCNNPILSCPLLCCFCCRYSSRLYIQRPTYVYKCNNPLSSRLFLRCFCCPYSSRLYTQWPTTLFVPPIYSTTHVCIQMQQPYLILSILVLLMLSLFVLPIYSMSSYPIGPAYIFSDLHMYTYAITLSGPVYCYVAYVVWATSQYCKFSAGQSTPPFYRRLIILNTNAIYFSPSLQIIVCVGVG